MALDQYMAQLSMAPQDEEQMARVAQQLKSQNQTGARLSTSSLENVANQGRLMQTQASQQTRDSGLMNYRKAALDQREGESKRRAAADLADTAERGLAKLSNAALDDIRKEAKQFNENQSIYDRYTPDMASKTGVRALGKFGRSLGTNWSGPLQLAADIGVLPQGEVDRQIKGANWFADLDFYRNNPIRHELFGSALTEPERLLWEASTIHEGMNDEVMAFRLGMMEKIDNKASAYKIQQLRAERVPEDIIWTNYGRQIGKAAYEDPQAYQDKMEVEIQEFAGQNQDAFMTDEELVNIANGGGQ